VLIAGDFNSIAHKRKPDIFDRVSVCVREWEREGERERSLFCFRVIGLPRKSPRHPRLTIFCLPSHLDRSPHLYPSFFPSCSGEQVVPPEGLPSGVYALMVSSSLGPDHPDHPHTRRNGGAAAASSTSTSGAAAGAPGAAAAAAAEGSRPPWEGVRLDCSGLQLGSMHDMAYGRCAVLSWKRAGVGGFPLCG
jgi:hypothetical protein